MREYIQCTATEVVVSCDPEEFMLQMSLQTTVVPALTTNNAGGHTNTRHEEEKTILQSNCTLAS